MNDKKNHQILSGGQAVVESFKVNDVKNVFRSMDEKNIIIYHIFLQVLHLLLDKKAY